MKVLVACEESQAVCTAFRERGHEAYSCDIQEPSGGHPEWLDFMGFYKWAMANGYSDGLTLDRIDPNGDYAPENCRWVSWKEQMNNKRSNRLISAFGKTLTVQEWSEATGIHRSTIVNRLKLGWTSEQAVTPGRRCCHG